MLPETFYVRSAEVKKLLLEPTIQFILGKKLLLEPNVRFMSGKNLPLELTVHFMSGKKLLLEPNGMVHVGQEIAAGGVVWGEIRAYRALGREQLQPQASGNRWLSAARVRSSRDPSL